MAGCCEIPGRGGRKKDVFSGCMLCGKALRYELIAVPRRCAVCGEEALSDAVCENGHFVCNACHAAGLDQFFIPSLLRSEEKDPLALLEQVMALPQVHMHGPEHHAIVPCVLLTAWHNNGGAGDLKTMLSAAMELTSRCLKRLAEVGGPRCCKRTSRLCVAEAAAFTAERFAISMPLGKTACGYMSENRECIGVKCPFFPHGGKEREA